MKSVNRNPEVILNLIPIFVVFFLSFQDSELGKLHFFNPNHNDAVTVLPTTLILKCLFHHLLS